MFLFQFVISLGKRVNQQIHELSEANNNPSNSRDVENGCFKGCRKGMFKAGTAQKMKFSIKDLFGKCDQIRRKLRIWSI